MSWIQVFEEVIYP